MLALIVYLKAYLKSLIKREEGQTMAEYALILFLIAVVVMVAILALGPVIANVYNQIAAAL